MSPESKTPTTPTQRKAAERERQRALGHTRLELYAPKAHHAQIKAFARELQNDARALQDKNSPPELP